MRERIYKANRKEGVRETIKMLVYRSNKRIKRNFISKNFIFDVHGMNESLIYCTEIIPA